MDTKEIKRQIRALRKCRKDTRKYTEERRDINERIRDLKAQLTPVIKEVDDTKEKLIAIIRQKQPSYLKAVIMDYSKFSVEELQKHIDRYCK